MSLGTEDQCLLGVHIVSPASREKAEGLAQVWFRVE